MTGFRNKNAITIGPADPLQLIRVPMVLASRQLKPENLAAIVHPPNLPMKARVKIAIVYPQIIPII
jgi:hypothetical protein